MPPLDPRPPEGKRSHRRLLLKLVLVMGIGSVVVAFIGWWSGRPSQGVVLTSGEPVLSENDRVKQRKRYQGKYFTFTYPYDFERRETGEVVKYPILERVYLSRSDIEGRKIALTLQNHAGYALEEYGSFRLRRMAPTEYTEAQWEKSGLSATLFVKDIAVFEAGAFFGRDGDVMSIVVSSPTTAEGLLEELKELLESFEWRVIPENVSGS